MDEELRKLAEAPLANPLKINLPLGRVPVKRGPERRTPAEGDLTPAQVRERKEQSLSRKQQSLLDYYATTNVPAARVAEHCGLYRFEDVLDESGAITDRKRVLDVERAEQGLQYRRRNAAG